MKTVIQEKSKSFIHKVYHLLIEFIFRIIGLFPKREIFFFESFHGKQFSDNPRAIYEFIKENNPNIKCIWAVKKGFEAPFIEYNVPYVRRMGMRWVLSMATAKYWVINTRLPFWMYKSKKTIYIQTWHGTPIKKLGLDIENVAIPGTNTTTYRENIINESARWDLLLSPNLFSTQVFKRAFHYDGKVLESGYPRNDVLITKSFSTEIKLIFKRLNINDSQGKFIILYAPTWRDDEFYKKGSYKFNNEFPFSELLDKNNDIIILVRTHYLVKNQVDLSEYKGQVIDCGEYPDIRELYLIADLLVTDYSSVMFDFAFTKKPMLFYMYDNDKYRNQTRGLYFDPVNILPGNIVETKSQLLTEIDYIMTHPNENDKYQKFCDTFCLYPNSGSACQEVINELEGL